MKKKFALLMCAVMLFGAMLACIPASAEAKTEGGPLAITEVCYAPANDKYEFVEVINISDNQVDLKDYYIYRYGFSNGGTYHATGIRQMFGFGTSAAKLVRLSLADAQGTTTIAKNEVAVVWFASAVSKDETVQDFKNYWSGRGCAMNDVKVVKLPVYDAAGTDLYPANHATDTLIQINTNSGGGFLPDHQAGFVLSFINKSFADTDDITPTSINDKGVGSWAKEGVQARHEASDTIAFVLLAKANSSEPEQASRLTNTSAHYYGFVNEAKFNAGKADYAEIEEGQSRKDNNYLPAGLMVFEGSDPTKDNVSLYKNTANKEEIVFPTVETKYLPNPGILYDGQMGQTGELRVNDAANGVGSINLTGGVKPVVENLAVINDDDAEETKAPETEAPAETTAPVEEEGCGSAIGASALLVIAPAFAAGCVVSAKKRRNRK